LRIAGRLRAMLIMLFLLLLLLFLLGKRQVLRLHFNSCNQKFNALLVTCGEYLKRPRQNLLTTDAFIILYNNNIDRKQLHFYVKK